MELGTRLGIFKILSPLGKGGMGEVYLARDTKLGRNVAVKVLPEGFAKEPDRLARFEREAQILAALNHPNVATVHGFEYDEKLDLHFLVMEHIDGETLSERIARDFLSVSEALPIFIDIARGLQAAHRAHVIHRDLKPDNIKISSSGVVKLIDFGIAKSSVNSMTQVSNMRTTPMSPVTLTTEGTFMGTPVYMSPEQALGGTIDKHTDIWSFGCCLFEALTGNLPFRGNSFEKIRNNILNKEPDWSRLPKDASKELHGLLKSCLTKDASERMGNTGEIVRILEKCIERGAAKPRQNARPILVSIAALLLVAVGGGAWWYTSSRSSPLSTPEEVAGSAETLSVSPTADFAAEVPVKEDTPTITAEEIATIGRIARDARAVAREIKGDTHLTEDFALAENTYIIASKLVIQEQYFEAQEKFNEATEAFTSIERETTEMIRALTELNIARAEMDKAKSGADAVRAQTWARREYEEAQTVESEASTLTDRLHQAAQYSIARELYIGASREALVQGETFVREARHSAELAQRNAQTRAVSSYAKSERARADTLMENAAGMASNFDEAKSYYEQATTEYVAAVSISTTRETEARRGADDARRKATALKDRIGSEERDRAKVILADADAAWAEAESVGDDYASARVDFDRSARYYSEAIELALRTAPKVLGVASYVTIESSHDWTSGRLDLGTMKVIPNRFIDNGDGTISDAYLGLEWQKSSSGVMTWEQASRWCDTITIGNKTNWRLPTVKELQTLTCQRGSTTGLDLAYFAENTSEKRYWTSVELVRRVILALSHSEKNVMEFNGANYKAVRAVREP